MRAAKRVRPPRRPKIVAVISRDGPENPLAALVGIDKKVSKPTSGPIDINEISGDKPIVTR